jgi:hypothetical protein
MLPESESDVFVISASSHHNTFPSTEEDNIEATKVTSNEVSAHILCLMCRKRSWFNENQITSAN